MLWPNRLHCCLYLSNFVQVDSFMLAMTNKVMDQLLLGRQASRGIRRCRLHPSVGACCSRCWLWYLPCSASNGWQRREAGLLCVHSMQSGLPRKGKGRGAASAEVDLLQLHSPLPSLPGICTCSHTVLGVDQSMVVLRAEVRRRLPPGCGTCIPPSPAFAAQDRNASGVTSPMPLWPEAGNPPPEAHASRHESVCQVEACCQTNSRPPPIPSPQPTLPHPPTTPPPNSNPQVEDKSDIIAASNKALDLVGVR